VDLGAGNRMTLDAEQARRRFAAARVARLATADATGVPHLVPIVFALVGDAIYSAVDAKPKRTTALRRLANVRANPRVAVLADHYEEDWTALWWVRADGAARILEPGHPAALDALAARYLQYRRDPPPGPVLEIAVETWTGWSAR
jgi:PPOX class probable F420-dependent enzyme